jgi:fumarate reductase flavoprotein subunit
MSQITRSQFVKGAVAAIAGTSLGAVVAAADEAAPQTGLKPGIYEGRAQGYKGYVTVHVEVDDEKILSVAVTENSETHTKVPSESAIDVLCPKIVETQSINLDTVAGATFTSLGILSAVKEALAQATDDLAPFQQAVERPETVLDDEEVDVVVVGSGVSGLMAALSCATVDLTRESTGLKVLVVERNHYVGGSSLLSDGGYALCQGTVCNEMYDTAFTGDGLADYLEGCCGEELNRPLIKRMVEWSGPTANGIFNLGSPFAIAKTELRLKLDNGEGYVSIRAKQYSDPRTDGAFGGRITDNLSENLREMGGEIRLDTTAESIVMEDGAAAGITVRSANNEVYTIRAKKVCLCAGGFGVNTEMIAEYAPEYVGSQPYCGGSSKGMGIQMAIDAVGAKVVGNGLNAYPGIDYRYGMGGVLSGLMAEGLFVNREGERFYDGRDVDIRVIGMKICQQTDTMAFLVMDQNASFVQAGMVDTALEQGWGYTADTLEELAEICGLPADAFMESVASMQAAVADGVDDPAYNVPEKYFNALEEGPFVALEVRSIAIGSLAGLDVSENCEVLDGDGNIVPNLFAAGETMIGGIFRKYYPLGSFSVGSCINTGRVAGEQAKATI